jgi:FOG: WD40 repeat
MPSTSTTSASSLMLTSSKDTFMKLWDLSTQHCVQTIVAHRSEIWTMDLDCERNIIFTGSGEGDLKAWSIDYKALSEGLKEKDSGEVGILISPHFLEWLEVLVSRFPKQYTPLQIFPFPLGTVSLNYHSTQPNHTLLSNHMIGLSKYFGYEQKKRSERSNPDETNARKIRRRKRRQRVGK